MNNYIKLYNLYGDSMNLDMQKSDSKINECDSDSHSIIIGKAGIGKSTYIIKNFSPDEYLMTAYTGIAAVQINGKTISRIFNLGRFNENNIATCIKKIKIFNKNLVKKLAILKGIVIDEFYTVPYSIIEKVNAICKIMRNNTDDFGGLKLILVGDDRQTECISESFIDSELYKSMKYKQIVLEEHDKMRLTKEYMNFCDMFRNPKLNGDKMRRLLNDKRFAQTEVPGYSVYYTNEEINKRNTDEMEKFNGDIIYGKYKKGCPIYINSSYGELCNGMMGTLDDYAYDNLHITIEDKLYIVESDSINFTPGFAMSIHKSQAKTFPGINIYIKKDDLLKDRKKYIRLLYVALTRVSHFNKCYINIS